MNEYNSQVIKRHGADLVPAKIVKKGNGKRIKSPYRDAMFFQRFRDVRNAALLAHGAGASVTYSTPSPLTPSSPSTSTSLQPIPSTSTNPIPSLPNVTPTPSPFISPKFERFVRGYTVPVETMLRRYRVPAEWRDLSAWFTALYQHHAAQSLGPVYSFTLNLRPDVEEMIRSKPSAATEILKRIRRNLLKAIPDAEPTFWFALETTDRRRLHLHGEIVTSDPEKARKALRLAGGEWEATRQHQAHTQESPDAGWIGYCLTLYGWLQKGRFEASRGFSGHPYACTQNLTRIARQLYEADRQVIHGGKVTS